MIEQQQGIMKNFIILVFIAAAIISCTKDRGNQFELVAPLFESAPLDGQDNYIWEEGDKVGMYMVVTTSASLTIPIKGFEALNTPYVATQSGSAATEFSAADSVIYYPTDGTIVDLYSYYPYSTTLVEAGIFNVDVSSQIESDIAVRTAGIRARSNANKSVEFSYANRLTKLNLELVPGEDVGELTGIDATISGHYKQAKVKIRTGEVFDRTNIDDFRLNVSDDGSRVEGILIPTDDALESSITFTLGAMSYVWDISELELEPGTEVSLKVSIEDTPVIIGGITITPWGDGTGGDIEANEVIN